MNLVASIMLLFAGSGVFMSGMKFMSDGLESSAGKGIRKLFGKISDNRLAGIGIGAGVTAIIQSSAATTVMVIGFVNAGIMTLFQATAIIMGANIGTTVTGLLVSLSSLNIGVFVSAFALIGILMTMFSKNKTVKDIGGVVCGLGLIFVGLDLMSGALEGNEQIRGAFAGLFSSISFPLLLIFFGALFTALIQSSSAATGLIITLVAQRVLPVESGLYIVLGTNIGTCITAIIASVGTSTNAKRAALIHLTFNLIGTVIFSLLLVFLNKYFVKLLTLMAPNAPAMQIAYFHIFFNLFTTLILVPFIRQLTWFATKVIRDKENDEEVLKLYYIDDRILHTPPIAVAQTLKEVLNMAEMARQNLDRAFNALTTGNVSEKDKIIRDEQKINYINRGVARYLVKMASLSLPTTDEKLVGSLHHVISDIERIGDYAENFLEDAEQMKEGGVEFTPAAIGELNEMYGKVTEMYRRAIKIFEYRDLSGLSSVDDIENQIDEMKILFEHTHIARLNAGECTVESGSHFYAVISALERIADHLTNVAYSIRSQGTMSANSMNKIKKAVEERTAKGEKQ